MADSLFTGLKAKYMSIADGARDKWKRLWRRQESPSIDGKPNTANKFMNGIKTTYRTAQGQWKMFWKREEAKSIKDVLKAESVEIADSRKERAADLAHLNVAEIAAVKKLFKEMNTEKVRAVGAGAEGNASSEGDAASHEQVIQQERIERSRRIFEPLSNEAKNDFVGLCFSGGGIRSATFNLGVITGLAKKEYLKQIDYLSTVSGGGYIGSWLTAWIKRDGCDEVQSTLKEKKVKDGRYLEPDPVRFLRKYSNYLAPRTGLLSTDLWALLAVYLRNVILNLALLVAVGAFVLALPLLGVHYGWRLASSDHHDTFLGLTRVLLIVAMGAIAYSFASFSRDVQPKFKIAQSIMNRPGLWIALPLLLAAMLMTYVLAPGFGNNLECVLGTSFRSQPGTTHAMGWFRTHIVSWISDTAWVQRLRSLPDKSGHPEMTRRAMEGALWYTVIWVAGTYAARVFEVFSGWHDVREALKLSAKAPLRKAERFWMILKNLSWMSLFSGGTGPKPISRSALVSLMATLLSGALGGLLLYGFELLLKSLPGALWQSLHTRSEIVQVYAPLVLWIILGPPLLLWAVSLVSILHVGLLGRSFPDAKREWLSRLCAILALTGMAWLVIIGLAFYGSVIFKFLFLSPWANTTWGRVLKWLVASGWLGATAGGIIGGNHAKSKPQRGNESTGTLLKLAPPIFVLGLMLLLSWGLDWYLRSTPLLDNGNTIIGPNISQYRDLVGRSSSATSIGEFVQRFSALVEMATPESARAAMDEVGTEHWLYAGNYLGPQSNTVRNLLVALIAIVLLLSWRLDVNEFSIHLLYRNRLARCYLGASRKDRKPQSFTGFDVDDDLPLASLRVEPKVPECNGASALQKGYYGPYHLVCTALNLVSGKELAWQTRKARSFFYSPLYCGYDFYDPIESTSKAAPAAPNTGKLGSNAFRPTEEFSGSPGPYLGTALAISGAAATPNMGYHSSPALTFLMGIFNVRLGWWAGNPRHKRTWNMFGPRLALYLGLEMIGRTDDEKAFVYLSDGGHFENLGLYELARRQCRYIIASDGGCDPDSSFSDLGNAIQKCRRDLGADILIDVSKLRPKNDERMSESHYAFGKITYSDGTEGTLLYLKSSLKKTDRQDVQSFAEEDGAFPHDTTADQFFNETRFESYRALGEDVLKSVVDDVIEKMKERDASAQLPLNTVAGLFTALEQMQSKATSKYQEAPLEKMMFFF